MENGKCTNVDLREVFCNDLKCCMQSIGRSKRPNNAYGQLALSLHVAVSYGVSFESVAATLLNQLSDSERQEAVGRLAEKFSLNESQIEKLLNPGE